MEHLKKSHERQIKRRIRCSTFLNDIVLSLLRLYFRKYCLHFKNRLVYKYEKTYKRQYKITSYVTNNFFLSANLRNQYDFEI